MESLLKRFESAIDRLEMATGTLGVPEKLKIPEAKPVSEREIPLIVEEFDKMMGGKVEEWAKLSAELGESVVSEISKEVVEIFPLFRNFLWTAAGKEKPSQQDVVILLKPVAEKMQKIGGFQNGPKISKKMLEYVSTVVDAMSGLNWVLLVGTPSEHLKNAIECAHYYGDKILRENKGNETHTNWVKSWYSIWETMHKYVEQFHKKGLAWNSQPGARPRASAPPPPPPLPAGGLVFKNITEPNENNLKDRRNALFDEINKGSGITGILKKVERNSRPVLKIKNGGEVVTKPQRVQKQPNIELKNGKLWNVEYFLNNPEVEVIVTDTKHAIYIYKCENSVIRVKGKANAITLDGCKKTSILFDGLVSICEIINCESIQVQTLAELPTVSIQKTDGCQVFLSRLAKNAQLITSKSSEMNISVQLDDSSDEFTEMSVPEQFVTSLNGDKLQTIVSESV